MKPARQTTLFAVPVDEARLTDQARTVLEAIDKLGSVDVRTAGKIVYRLRGAKAPGLVRSDWLISAGWRAIDRLRELGLVQQRCSGRWVRARRVGGERRPLAEGERIP